MDEFDMDPPPVDFGPYSVLRVLQHAITPDAPPPPSTRCYYPAAAVRLAGAHRWMPYDDFISFVRDLMTEPFYDTGKRDLKNFFMNLDRRLPPFSVSTRFPADEFYVCIDRAPLSLPLLRISHGLALGTNDLLRENLNGWREHYYQGAHEAMELVTGNGDRKASQPVIYNRRIFESVFGLEWVD